MPDFRRRKNRWDGFDYSADGDYFVTICTVQRSCILGNILPGTSSVRMSEYGQAVLFAIERLRTVFPHVRIPIYVIMPNHVHMILSLTESEHSLSSIINYFKGTVTKITKGGIWQKSFYDHVIRDENDYNRICDYIENNPAAWSSDDYYAPD